MACARRGRSGAESLVGGEGAQPRRVWLSGEDGIGELGCAGHRWGIALGAARRDGAGRAAHPNPGTGPRHFARLFRVQGGTAGACECHGGSWVRLAPLC